MNGSQYHYHQALTMIRPSTEALKNRSHTTQPKAQQSKKRFALLALILITLTLTSIAHAGPSQPRLKGGNGNANGR